VKEVTKAPRARTFVDGDVKGGLPALVPGVEVCARRRDHFHHPGLVPKRRMVHSLNKDDFLLLVANATLFYLYFTGR
jgi:hypothetical protein